VLLGWLHENALYSTAEESSKSQEYYEAAYAQKDALLQEAQKGEVTAQYHVGLMYVHTPRASSVERNEGVSHLTRAAQQNHPESQRELGVLYHAGNSVEKNLDTAVYCYQSAAKNGDTKAMYYLALCYEQGLGIERNQALAIEWYGKAAEKGDALAQNNLGLCYEQGNGVKQDFVKAEKYYELAAQQGYALSQHNLAVIYENGHQGVPQDLVKAAQYYHLAVSQQQPRAQNNLARFYEEGLGGMPVPKTPKDAKQAFELYEKSALQKYSRAQYNLGRCYECGIGTSKNNNKAKQYYQLAVDANERISPDAKKALEKLTKALETLPFGQMLPKTSAPQSPAFQLPSQNKPPRPF